MALLLWLASAGPALADLYITTDTTQNGGTLTVNPASALIVSDAANDPLLTLTNSAGTSGVEGAIIGSLTGETGNLLIDDGSTLANDGNGTLGTYGAWSILRGAGHIGLNSGSTGQVTVDGPGSTWTNNRELHVGYAGDGTLSITNGGSVSNNYEARIGFRDASTGQVTVDGAGSSWTIAWELHTGVQGDGALMITNGGTVSNRPGGSNTISLIGSLSTGQVTVDGTGSTWTNGGHVAVGYSTDGDGTLSITNGGSVSNRDGYIGYYSGSTGQVTVDGVGSTWANSGQLTVGNYYGGTGTLSILNGGSVSVDEYTLIGQDGGSASSIVLNNGMLTTAGLLASPNDLAGTGTVNTTGLVSDLALVFDQTNSHQQQLTYDSQPGQNITVNLDVDGSGVMGAGYRGQGSLSIADGVTVDSASGYLGYHAGSTGDATVDGTGSNWNNSGAVQVGYNGYGTLSISNGGTVSSVAGHIGTGSTNNHDATGQVTVDGPGSTWTSSGITVGNYGDGTLTITNGGSVSNVVFVGRFSESLGQVTVDGAGSNITNSSHLFVGYGGDGTLNITNGGSVSNVSGHIGGYSSSNSATGQVIVNGAGSAWSNSGSLLVGYYDEGSLSTTNGGHVSSSTGYIGFSSGSVGQATLDGAGSTWTNTGNLFVGYSGAGTLNVTGDGTVEIGGTLSIAFNSSSSGTVNLAGGTLDLQGNNITQGAGTATFSFTGGMLKNVNEFAMNLHQQAGTLAAGSSPGHMVIDGDYTLDSGAVIQVELAGANGVAGTDLDRYDITGDAMLSGTLQILGHNDFTPAAGAAFDVLTANTIDTTGLTLDGFELFTYEVLPYGDIQLLRLTSVPEPTSALLVSLGGLALLRRRRPVSSPPPSPRSARTRTPWRRGVPSSVRHLRISSAINHASAATA